ncbi:hypothetical protein DFQ28_006151 [Apophysomyces sp. BC1034]|nr:hypothetical protein DFQ28_006151 [Apophysomyces sp. BC1034]
MQPSRHTVPGTATIFALRAIGLALLARWLQSMLQMGFVSVLTSVASSPWACLNVILLFLLIALPGAQARAERPFHPLLQWLRQALRCFALVCFLFAAWSIGMFVASAGPKAALRAVVDSNGWLAVSPGLYAAVVWICRPRPLWRSNFAARRFAMGRYAVSVDRVTRTTVVWVESRKVGQYDSRELSVRFANEHVPIRAWRRWISAAQPRAELLWNSPAAAGHNRQRVMRVVLKSDADRNASRALDKALASLDA